MLVDLNFDLYPLGSDPTRLHETFLESDPNEISFESHPVWVRIADLNGFGSVESRINVRPIPYSFGTDPFGSELIPSQQTLRCLYVHLLVISMRAKPGVICLTGEQQKSGCTG